MVPLLILFVTVRIRVDAVALMIPESPILTGSITPAEELSGIANMASTQSTG
jgi:hypothetical protein